MSSESNDDSDASGRNFNDQFTPIDKEVIPSSVISGVIEQVVAVFRNVVQSDDLMT